MVKPAMLGAQTAVCGLTPAAVAVASIGIAAFTGYTGLAIAQPVPGLICIIGSYVG